jgi:hypothetical protein
MVQCLAKAETRIEQQTITRDTGGPGHRQTVAQEALYFGDDIGVVRLFLHAQGLALHVHQANSTVAVGDCRQCARHAQRVDVIDHRSAVPKCSPHHLRLVGVDRNRNTAAGKFFKHRHEAPQLLFDRGGKRSWTRRLGTNVKQIGARFDLPVSVRDCLGGVAYPVTRE